MTLTFSEATGCHGDDITSSALHITCATFLLMDDLGIKKSSYLIVTHLVL